MLKGSTENSPPPPCSQSPSPPSGKSFSTPPSHICSVLLGAATAGRGQRSHMPGDRAAQLQGRDSGLPPLPPGASVWALKRASCLPFMDELFQGGTLGDQLGQVALEDHKGEDGQEVVCTAAKGGQTESSLAPQPAVPGDSGARDSCSSAAFRAGPAQ